MKYHLPRTGFTLIELIVVIAIIGVLIGVVVLPLVKFRQQQALQNSTNAIVAVLNDARTKTFAALNNTSYSVYLSSTAATLFTGTTYSSGTSTNEVYTLEFPVTASWSLQGAGNSILFDRLKGTTSQYGTITLSISGGATKTVTITALGTVTRN